MALPAKQKTWTFFAINARAPGSVGNAEVNKPVFLTLKNGLKAVPGATVIGSSDGTTAANDGTDRIIDATKIIFAPSGGARSWIRIRMTNMGNLEVLLACDTDSVYGGHLITSGIAGFTGGTTTANPTATDQTLHTNINSGSQVTLDQLSNFAYASDGTAFFWLKAYNSAWYTFFLAQMISSTVTNGNAPTAFTWSAGTVPALTFGGAQIAKIHINGGSGYIGATSPSLITGYEALNQNSTPAVQTIGAPMELQGSQFGIADLSLWYTGSPHRGKIGNLVDLWYGPTSVAHGTTFPANGDREFIAAGPFVFPWNGTPGVPGTMPQLI